MPRPLVPRTPRMPLRRAHPRSCVVVANDVSKLPGTRLSGEFDDLACARDCLPRGLAATRTTYQTTVEAIGTMPTPAVLRESILDR